MQGSAALALLFCCLMADFMKLGTEGFQGHEFRRGDLKGLHKNVRVDAGKSRSFMHGISSLWGAGSCPPPSGVIEGDA